MSIIYTYPTITGNINDNVLVSDSTNNNSTSQVSISRIKDLIDVVETLNTLKGDINITGGTNITVTPSGQNIEISTSASNVDGSGTANKIPMWSDSNTLTDSQFESQASGVLDIPNYIRHIGDTGNFFGFGSTAASSEFLVYTEGSGSPLDQESLRIRPSGTAIKTNATTRLNTTVAGAIELYYAGSKKFETLSSGTQFTGVLDIESNIRHTGDGDSVFGFPSNDNFQVSVNSGSDQFSVIPNQTLMKTDSTIKFIGSDSGIILYHVRESTVTTSTDRKLETDPDGIKIKGKNTTNQPGALADTGGTIKFYSSGNNKYVGIQGPVDNDGSDYVLRMPKSVGTTNQVLKLPTSPVSGNNQLEWGDAGGGGVGTSHLIHDITAAEGTVTHNYTTFKQFLTPGQEVDVNTIQCFLLDASGESNNTFGLFSGELSKGTGLLLAYGTLTASTVPVSTLGYNNVPLLDSDGTQITVRLSVGTNYFIAWSTDTSNNLVGSTSVSKLVSTGPVNVLSNSSDFFTDASAMKNMTASTIASAYTLDGIDCASIVLFKDTTPIAPPKAEDK